MVIRSFIGAVVHRLPYSDKIPEGIRSILDESPTPAPVTLDNELEPRLGPAEKIRSRMLRKRAATGLISSSSSTKMDSFVDADDGVFSDDDTSNWKPGVREGPNPMTEKYLNEQNEEFNSLINRNLDEVIQQQDSFSEEVGWQRLVLELAMARNSTEVTSKVNSLMNKFSDTAYSYIPFIHNEDQEHLPKSLEVPGSRNIALDILDDMDYDTKVLLLKQLAIDLGLGTNTKDITEYTRNLTLPNDATMIDKIELLLLLSIRLSFVGLKFFGPICSLLYEKFKNDEILLLNNKNFSKLLSVLIRVMEGFERKMASKSKKHEAVRI